MGRRADLEPRQLRARDCWGRTPAARPMEKLADLRDLRKERCFVLLLLLVEEGVE